MPDGFQPYWVMQDRNQRIRALKQGIRLVWAAYHPAKKRMGLRLKEAGRVSVWVKPDAWEHLPHMRADPGLDLATIIKTLRGYKGEL